MAQSIIDTPLAGTAPGIRAAATRRQLVLTVTAVMVAMLLSALDQTIVGTAMPRIMAELNGLTHYGWVFTAYMLASTVTVPIFGKLGDTYGRRPFFLIGIGIFLLGSVLCGASRSMLQLALFRGLQGLGAGAMMPTSQAILGDIFPPAERGKWQGMIMTVFALATGIGPALGGWLTDHWGWRWIFGINLPVGAVALLIGWLSLPRSSRVERHAIDYLGAATLIAGAVPLLLGFSWAGSEYPWLSAPILSLLAGGLLMLALFFFVVERRAPEPIISPALFRNSIFSVAVSSVFLVSFGMYGAILYLPLFIQAVVGASATRSGLVLTPLVLGLIVSNVVGGQLMARTGRYQLLIRSGLILDGVGLILLSRMTTETTIRVAMINMLITGLGIGVNVGLVLTVVQNAFPFEQLGQATASLQFFRSIGGTVSVALLSSLLATRFAHAFAASLPPAAHQLLSPAQIVPLQNPKLLLDRAATTAVERSFAALGPQGSALYVEVLAAIRRALASAITDTFTYSAVVVALAIVLTFFLREIPLRKSHAKAPPPTEASYS